jgi:hypothetical protein
MERRIFYPGTQQQQTKKNNTKQQQQQQENKGKHKSSTKKRHIENIIYHYICDPSRSIACDFLAIKWLLICQRNPIKPSLNNLQ